MIIHSLRASRGATGALAAMLLVGTALGAASPAGAAQPECTSVGGAMQVTADCLDPTYATPVIDSETDETSPTPHHRVRGHFEGTNIQFTIYLHAQADKSKWEGRFFKFTYPTAFTPAQDT